MVYFCFYLHCLVVLALFSSALSTSKAKSQAEEFAHTLEERARNLGVDMETSMIWHILEHLKLQTCGILLIR